MLKELMAMAVIAGLVTGNGPVGQVAAPVVTFVKSVVAGPQSPGQKMRDLVAGDGPRPLLALARR